jgi:hypothetical protein
MLSAALQSGDVDWLEAVHPDLLPVLRKSPSITLAINDPLGSIGFVIMNHLFPPFNDVRARRAILMAIRQEDSMRAFVGDDDSQWKPIAGYFAPGTPLYNEEGGEILKGPRRFDLAKRLLAEAGYTGEPMTLMAGPCAFQGLGRCDGRSAPAPWRQGGLCRGRLGQARRAGAAKIAAQPGRMAYVCQQRLLRRLRRRNQLVFSRRWQRSSQWFREQCASRSGGCGVV